MSPGGRLIAITVLPVIIGASLVVTAEDRIVAAGELPELWGLMTVRRGKVVCVKAAPLLPHADPRHPAAVERSFLACLLRANGDVPVPVLAP